MFRRGLLLIASCLVIPALAQAEITGAYTYPGGNNGDIQFNDNGVFGGISSTSFSGGGAFGDLSDVDDSARAVDSDICFDGTNWVAIARGGSCSFSIASFSDALSSTQLIGTGVWKATGTISFTASYSNGPPIGSTITFSGWSSLPLSSPFTSATSVANVNYPSVAGSVAFTLTAKKDSTTATSTITHNFYNYRFWGTTIAASGYTEAIVEGIGNSEISNSLSKTFTVNATAGQYIIWASPTRLGTVTFTVGGFSGGFNSPDTVSITNSAGFTENYYVYRSANHSLGSTTVTTQ